METVKVNEVFWAGLDVGQKVFDAAVVGPGFVLGSGAKLRELAVRRFERTFAGAKAFVLWAWDQVADGAELRAVMESTGPSSTELADWLIKLDKAMGPAIVNPMYTANFIKSLGVRNKTDQLDARGLALFGRERRPQAYQPLSKGRAKLRELTRYREFVVEQRAACLIRIKHPCSAQVKRMQEKMIARMDHEEKRLLKLMHALVRKDEKLSRDVALLESIYGVGFLTAVVVLAEAGDLRRFDHARQLTAYAGMTPRLFQSGSSLDASCLSKQGNGRLRRALYMSTVTLVSGENDLADYHRQLRAQGKCYKSATLAVARKLLVLMRALLISGQEWKPRNASSGKLGEELVEKAA